MTALPLVRYPHPRRILIAHAITLLLGAVGDTRATEPLPPDPTAQRVLSMHPLWRSATAQQAADRAQARQTAIGPGEWSVDLTAGQRRYRGATAVEPGTREWRTDLSRPWRLPRQVQADEAAGDAAARLADAHWRLTWHSLASDLLEAQAEALLVQRQAAIWADQVDVARQQASAVRQRVHLGDAARIDRVQAEAALAQAEAHAAAAGQRLAAVQRRLAGRFPGWPQLVWPSADDSWTTAKAAGLKVPPALNEPMRLAWLQQHPEQQLAVARLALAEQQARQADAARTGTPTVGLGLARDRSGAEQALLLQVSVPLGGEYRDLTAKAQYAQFAAFSAQQLAQQALAEAQLQQQWQDTRDTLARWTFQREALTRLDEAAQALEKGYRLGEGQLEQVLQARRLTREQALQAAQAESEAWLSLWRWQLGSGQRWPAPDQGQPTPSEPASSTAGATALNSTASAPGAPR